MDASHGDENSFLVQGKFGGMADFVGVARQDVKVLVQPERRVCKHGLMRSRMMSPLRAR